jgi:flagellar motor switch protein FliN/FliY
MSMKTRDSGPGVALESFEFLGDVPVAIVAELDRRTISIRELLDLRAGSVLALTRPTGENIDLYAGNVLIGYGEVLVVESSLAVRLADLREKSGEGIERRAITAPKAEAESS